MKPNEIVASNVRSGPVTHTIIPPPLDPAQAAPGVYAPKTVKAESEQQHGTAAEKDAHSKSHGR